MDDQPKPGLRERKKQKTRFSIQQHALRLIRDQGYSATTIEQIAEASEISPSTFFRYFPTKEALVLEDDYDPVLIQAFKDQPAELSPIQAFRRAAKEGLSSLNEEERGALQERMELIMSVPELRAASMNHISETMRMISELVAERVGRGNDELEVITFAGAVMGVIISLQFYYMNHPKADLLSILDQALAQLEAGLPL